MAQLHIIPLLKELSISFELAEKYNAAFEYNDFYSPSVLDDPYQVDKIINRYKNLNRNTSRDTLHGAFLDITIHSTDRLMREASEFRILQSLDIAQRLGCKAVVFHTNFISNFTVPFYTEHWLSSNEDFFRKMLEQFPNLCIYMENMFDTSPYLLHKLAERMADASRFGVCFDVAHAHLSDSSFDCWYDLLSPYIRHIHLNDNTRQMDSHDAIGDGNFDWLHFNSRLTSNPFSPSALIEVSDTQKLKKSLAYMEKHSIYPFAEDNKDIL